MGIFRFQTLWENHPNVKGSVPILDKTIYPNQCAINLSASLITSGISMNDFRGARSWEKNKPKYAIRAQEVADWLKARPRFPSKMFVKVDAKNFDKELSQRSGIIFFQNYWGPRNQGDHIDLWNGSRLTDWRSWARINIHFGSYGLHNLGAGSDFKKAESVWFWAIS